MCDPDIDGDSVLNINDNCPHLSNSDQTDSDSDGVGDACSSDSDGDGVLDYNDTCPHNPLISVTSFKKYTAVDLYPSLTTTAPAWSVKSSGVEVVQTASSGMPTMLIGKYPLYRNMRTKFCILKFKQGGFAILCPFKQYISHNRLMGWIMAVCNGTCLQLK